MSFPVGWLSHAAAWLELPRSGVAVLAPAGWVVPALVGAGVLAAVVAFVLGRRNAGAENAAFFRRSKAQLWSAIVTREGDGFAWTFNMRPSALFQDLFGREEDFQRAHPWRLVISPEQAAMDQRSQHALRSGAPGYSQEFPIERDGRKFWLQEHVTIHPQGEGRWLLVGAITDVTAMHEEQERLRDRDRLVLQALARADCLLWRATVRVEGRGVTWTRFDVAVSALYRRLFGTREPSSGTTLWSLLDVPNLPEMNARSTQAILSGASGYEQEFQAMRERAVFWLHEQVSIAPAGANEYHLVGVIMDVTALRSALEARKTSEAHIEHLLSRADCLLWQARVFREGAGPLRWVLYVPRSNLHRRLFGGDPGTPPRLDWDSVVSREQERAMHAKAQDAILSGTTTYEQDIHARRPEREFWLHERVNIQAINQDEWYLVGAIFDVSELHHAEAALAAEKERLSVTLAAMSDAVFTTDAEGRVQFVNRAAGRLLGRDAIALVGHPAAHICRFVDAAGQPVAPAVDDVLRRDATLLLPGQLRMIGAGGRKVAVEGALAPVHDAAGRVVGVVIVVRDVTERERLEQEISRASKLQSIGLLAGGIAHDFNNLLTVILGNVAVMKTSLPAEGELVSCLGEAERAVLRAKDLTQQLLTFARGGDPVRTAVQLSETITEAAAFGARGSAVRCEFDLAPDLWLADVDRGQIAQVVQNLVLNAVQAMPRGGVVRISARNETVPAGTAAVQPGDYVRLTVADSGCGISREDLNRIFDPYFTTKPQESGLGLATAYSIIKKHRGAIDVSSEPEVGTTFQILLPAARHATTPRGPAVAALPARLHGRVLLMDDEEPIRKVAGRMLSRLGLAVETAADGAAAVELFRAARDAGRPFDVVMVDLTVPGGMGGLEAFQAMRRLDPGVRGIVCSGYSNDMIMGSFREHGFVGMIPKPYRLDDCAKALGDVLPRPHGGAPSRTG